jgi:uncharacterized membrane protein YfcA
MPLDLNTLVNPPFAQDPPVKLNIDARLLGLVVAIISALGALFAVLALLIIGTHPLALIGSLVAIVGGVLAAVGGWRMYRGNMEGKRLVIYSLALSFISAIVTGIGYAKLGNAILSLCVTAVIYYLVVISRFSQAPPPPPPAPPGPG